MGRALAAAVMGALLATAPGLALPGAAAASPEAATVFGSSVAAARNADGRLELFGTNSGDAIYHRSQNSIGGTWGPWAQFDGALRAVASETNADGRVELFGVNSGGSIYHRSQTSPGGTWAGWEQFDG
ncbi:tectonin domain-containing protein, partial [Streptomyces sp. ISL-11]|uniref:tectonin domain-containing protein n=1 Tax=Streptomyces sp. ISL-11 TaxID=2819174 RepID=UPI0027E57573